MEIPTLQVGGVDYGHPSSPFVVIWSGPVDGSGFATLAEAQKEIELHKAVRAPNSFQARVFTLNEQKTEWISV